MRNARLGIALLALIVAGCAAGTVPAPSMPSAVQVPAPTKSGSTEVASVIPTPTIAPTPSPTADPALSACLRIVGSIPFVKVESGKPTIAAAYEVTGLQMTRYFETVLGHGDGPVGNGSDWWDSPTTMVDMCVFDGDFYAETPGPPVGNGDQTATRVLVVSDASDTSSWAFCFSRMTSCAISLADPATIGGSPSSSAASTALPSPSQEPTSPPLPVPTGYEVTIAPGIQPRWTVAQAASQVMGYLVNMRRIAEPYAPAWALVEPRVLSVSAMKLRDVPQDLYGRWNSDSEHQDPNEVIWLVKGQGTFLNNMVPAETSWGTNGWWFFDDQGNNILSGEDTVLPSAAPS